MSEINLTDPTNPVDTCQELQTGYWTLVKRCVRETPHGFLTDDGFCECAEKLARG